MRFPIWSVSLVTVALSCSFSFRAAASSDEEKIRQDLREDYTQPSTIPYPASNPFTKEKAELGKVLFFDTRLSEKKNQNCISCHQPGLGWEIGMRRPLGAQEMPVKSPTLQNLAWSENYFWDGRADTLEKQFGIAMASAKAMNLPAAEMEKRIRAIPGYQKLFEGAFPGRGLSPDTIAEAVATYERGIVTGPAPFDRWLAGDNNALSPAAKRGLKTFTGKANCVACHSGWNFTDSGFHDIGMDDENIGRAKVLNSPVMQHAFKTPGLRNIASRAPYTHTGEVTTLEAMVELYDRGGELLAHGKARRENQAAEVKPLHLSENEKKDLVEFLRALSTVDAPTTFPALPQ